jgi:hypothetical protein
VYVAFLLEVGLLLIVLPWSGFWEQNYFANTWPPLLALLRNNYVRGAVSGLGLVNLCGGFADLALIFAARERPVIHDLRDSKDVNDDVHRVP